MVSLHHQGLEWALLHFVPHLYGCSEVKDDNKFYPYFPLMKEGEIVPSGINFSQLEKPPKLPGEIINAQTIIAFKKKQFKVREDELGAERVLHSATISESIAWV